MASFSYLYYYLAVWIVYCFGAVAFAASDRSFKSLVKPYVGYLLVPWKLVLFLPAGIFVTFAGQFAWDDTWDLVSGAGMSILTFLTAPLTLGIAVQVYQRRLPARLLIIASAMMLFSASWFYDGWLLLRDGRYPNMWLPNLLLSPYLYVLAGVVWNLEESDDGRVGLGFMRSNWPTASTTSRMTLRLAMAMFPAIALVAAILIFSVQWRF